MKDELQVPFEKRKCYPKDVGSNTARHHIFRSLYFYQLRIWTDTFPIDRFLFVSNKMLRDRTQHTFNRFHQFVGLPYFKYKQHTGVELDTMIHERYPDLDARGDVRNDPTEPYTPLDAPTRKVLK
jgi:hypothetical protein